MNSDPGPWVGAFVGLLLELGDAIVQELGLAGLADILPLVRRGDMPRVGVTASGIGYDVHGIGCVLRSTAGQEIDIDFTPDGTPIFDPWRIKSFAGSNDASVALSEEAILLACRALVDEALLVEPRQGWFTPTGLASSGGVSDVSNDSSLWRADAAVRRDPN
ncbi:MAG: hypothetical protein J2P17_29050 [Mycobacterium sp.]|nr:hypothetical protein [Mycobacterium sp.]